MKKPLTNQERLRRNARRRARRQWFALAAIGFVVEHFLAKVW